MKYFTLIVALLISFNANAVDVDAICTGAHDAGATVMTGRQSGAPITSFAGMMSSALGRQMVLDAYDVPRWNTEENQKKAVEDYANKIALQCYKEFSAAGA